MEAYTADPSTFTGRPRLPKYKDKVKGRNILIYDTQALGKRFFRKTGKLVPSGLPIEIDTCITEWRQVAQVRIVPQPGGYMVEVVYDQQEEQAEVDQQRVSALDPGRQRPGRARPSPSPVLSPVWSAGSPSKASTSGTINNARSTKAA